MGIAADGVIATNNQTKAPKVHAPIQPSEKSFEVEMKCDVSDSVIEVCVM